MFLTFVVLLLIIKFFVLGTGDATLAHLGIVMDMGVGETPPFEEENLHAQQQNRQSYNHQSKQ